MAEIESTATALANSLVVDESNAQENDVIADQLLEAAAQDAPAQETQAAEETEAAQETEAQTPEAAREAEIKSGMRELMESGWTLDMLQAFAQDEGVLQAIAGGKSVAQAANAYAVRMMHAQGEQGGAKKRQKTGVPGVHKAAAADAKPTMDIGDMDDAQFDAFSRRAQQLAHEGKKVRM